MTKCTLNLNERQRKFVEEYVRSGNGAESYKSAYDSIKSDGAARANASRLLRQKKIAEAVDCVKRSVERKQEVKFRERTITLDKGVYEFIRQHVNGYDDLSEVVNQLVIKSLPNDIESLDKWLELNKRQTISDSVRYEVLSKAGFRCEACGDRPSNNKDCVLEVDHVVPHSLGGLDHISNYQSLCKRCNASKGNRYAIDHRQKKEEVMI